MNTITPRFNIVTTNRPSAKLSHGNYGDMVSVMLLNDDITRMSYVVRCLVEIFEMSHSHADNTMKMAHYSGTAVVGIYSLGLAEELLDKVKILNQSNGENLAFRLVD